MSPVTLLVLLAAGVLAGRRGRREPSTNGSWLCVGFGPILGHFLRQKVANYCLRGASLQQLADRLSKDEFDNTTTLIVMLGNSIGVRKSHLEDLLRALSAVEQRGIHKIILCAFPYSSNMGLLEFEKWSNQPDLFSEKSRMCAKLRGLTPGQRRVCRRHKDHMTAVSSGVKTGIQECQYQFKLRRWNCSITGDETVFGPLTLIASRETAFTHAITAAGVSIAVSRACRDGRLASCGCSRAARPRDLHKDWVWAGCGDDLHYGYKFTEGFVDIRERERKVKRGSREQGRQLMNRHNNEAGRRAVIKKSRVTCKCHGVSGSCSLITCWQQLATFREIGDYLRDKYEGATGVKVSRRGKLRLRDPRYRLPTAQDLVYLEDSPDYCVRDEALGSLGTTGRECNRTSAGMDGCALMCCGRGYNTKKMTIRERCGCKFHWCCRVDCNTCVKTVEVYTCK